MNIYVKILLYKKYHKILILNVLLVKMKKKNIIYYIYDIDNMKYLYICCNCKSSWKTE